MKSLLVISGFDPSGGAGFIVDMQVASRIGLLPVGVITNNTVQNSRHFYKNYHGSFDVIKDQIEAIVEERRPDAVKIGMIGQFKMVDAIVDILIEQKFPNVVLDPLFKASTGFELANPQAFKTMKERLFPKVFLLTPNISEAERITGNVINNTVDMQDTAKLISESYDIPAVVVKGGHLEGEPVDVLYYLNSFVTLRGKRLKGDFHGTGCVFSSAIASFLALGMTAENAFRNAHQFQHSMMKRRVDGQWNFFVMPNHKPF